MEKILMKHAVIDHIQLYPLQFFSLIQLFSLHYISIFAQFIYSI